VQADHLARAVAVAEQSGDLVQLARALVNQSDAQLRQADYRRALASASRAARHAGVGGPPGLLITALNNMGEALTRLGDFDSAELHLRRSVGICRRMGLQRTAMGLCGLAELNRERGRREPSRVAFEEALGLVRETGEVQILVPALTGLARLLAEGPDPEPERAAALAQEAVRVAPADLLARAHCAAGWVALARGDLDQTREQAGLARDAARARRAVDATAEAAELAAMVAGSAQDRRAALLEALAIWRQAGAATAADRIVVLLGRLPGADGEQRGAARAATGRLVAAGIQVVGGSPLFPTEGSGLPVRIHLLGGFEVIVAGRPVPLTAWRSKQARTLLKILVSRRGRPVGRAALCELLWPDDDPTRTGHRLSVLLNAVRGVLDPGRIWPSEHILRADLAGLSIDPTHVAVDAEELLRDAEHALALERAGDRRQAEEVLAEVDAQYRGDAFEDEPYEEWADSLRELVRAAWMGALRQRARLCRRLQDWDGSVACLVRLLTADPYDESGHRELVQTLVEAGRHGEARRAFDRWAAAMRAIDVPEPDRSVLARSRSSGAGGRAG
jgi:DNA-binding SARP family transcriptional activator